MTYYNQLIFLLTFNDFFFVKLVTIFICILLNIVLIKKLFKPLWPNGYEPFDIFKIKRKYITWFSISMYIGIFIIFILIRRIFRMGTALDLKPIGTFFYALYKKEEYFMGLFISLSICICLLLLIVILKKLKNSLELSLMRQHLYLQYSDETAYENYKPKTIKLKYVSVHNYYQEILYWFKKISFTTFCSRLHSIFLDIYHITNRNNYKYLAYTVEKIRHITLALVTLEYNVFSIPILIGYDIYYHHWVITKLFYFLPFYFIYVLWVRVSLFLFTIYQIRFLNEIVYEIYYCQPDILYLELSEEEHMTVLLYIRGALHLSEKVYFIYSEYPLQILLNKRYKLIDKESNLYYCNNTSTYKRVIHKENEKQHEEPFSQNILKHAVD
jgi:hypothetical protein